MPEKPWYLSRAVWGALVTIGAAIAGLFGVSFDEGAVTEAVLQVVAAIGGLTALWGRIVASTRLV